MVITNIKQAREFIYYRDNGICNYCGEKVDKDHIVIRHIKMASRFTDHSINNISLCCDTCRFNHSISVSDRSKIKNRIRVRNKDYSEDLKKSFEYILYLYYNFTKQDTINRTTPIYILTKGTTIRAFHNKAACAKFLNKPFSSISNTEQKIKGYLLRAVYLEKC